ncbi:Two component regulator propeller [Ostertagia ostertagi]
MPSMHSARRVCQILALLVLPFCCLTKVHAQRYPFYNVSIEHGLIQSQVQCMVQDKAGHLWVGTLGGLSRYDGHSFNTYSVRDGLPDNSVQALDADASGTIWIGTKKGLATYDGPSVSLLYNADAGRFQEEDLARH